MTYNKKYITKLIAASLLGDGHVGKPESKHCRFSLSQRHDHKDYLEWFANRIDCVTSLSIDYPSAAHKETRTVPFYDRSITIQPQLRLRTKTHPFFDKFRERMYGTGRKSVDLHYLTLLDAEFLAIWYQEDGSFSVDYRGKIPLPRIYIASESFSEAENVLLRKALKEKLDLDWNVHTSVNKLGNRTYKLYLSVKSANTFFELVTPYVVPSFYYKVNVERLTPGIRDDDIVQPVLKDTELDRNDLAVHVCT